MYPLGVIEYVLLKGPAARLNRRLLNKSNKIAFQAAGGIDVRGGVAVFRLFVVVNTESMLTVCQNALAAEFDRLRRAFVTEAELIRAKRELQADMFDRLSTPTGLAFGLAEAFLSLPDFSSLSERARTELEVTPYDIRAAANRYFRPREHGPREREDEMNRTGRGSHPPGRRASAAPAYGQREAFRRNPPPAEPLYELRLPEIQSTVLTNGLELSVLTREDPAGMTSLQLLIFAGEAFSPPAQPGLASAAAQMFARGTELLSSSDVEDRLADVGGSLSVRVHPDYVLFSFRFLSEFLDPALELLSQLILQPSRTENELNDIKLTQTLAFIEQDRDPESVAPRHLVRVLFQGHPYRNASFSRDLVRSWTLRDVNAFADALYRPNNAHLVIGGNLNLNTAVRKVSHLLGVWPAKDLPPSPFRAVRPPERERICLIDVPRARDCMITMGTVFSPPGVADRLALTVLGQVLGGTPASRLFMNLRESKNYAYFASCETQFLRATGLVTIRAKVKPGIPSSPRSGRSSASSGLPPASRSRPRTSSRPRPT